MQRTCGEFRGKRFEDPPVLRLSQEGERGGGDCGVEKSLSQKPPP